MAGGAPEMTSPHAASPAAGITRNGDQIVVPRNSSFPDHCFVCGKPAVGNPIAMHLHITNRYRRNVFSITAAGWLFALDVVAYLIFIVAFIIDLPASRRRRIQFGLCARHRAKRVWLHGLS